MLTEISVKLEGDLKELIQSLNADQEKISNKLGMLYSSQILDIYIKGQECVWYDNEVEFSVEELTKDYDNLIESVRIMMCIYDCFNLEKNICLIEFYFKYKDVKYSILKELDKK